MQCLNNRGSAPIRNLSSRPCVTARCTLGGLILATLLVAFFASASQSTAADWRAGVAKVKITPERPMWMSGYANRTHPATGLLNDLWAKALFLDDGQGHRAVLVTMDLVGIPRDMAAEICRRIMERRKLARAQIALCVSHTHSGPIVGSNLNLMFDFNADQKRQIDEYVVTLEKKIVTVVDAAASRSAPAKLSWAIGKATFAVNRRNNKEQNVLALRETNALVGPTDTDLPVLAVRDVEGKPLAVVFGYACHATTLDGYEWSSDWPGFAQSEIEAAEHGATALFFAGCGADQNPLPRRTAELARDYGRQAAAGVAAALAGPMKSINGPLTAAFAEIDLPYAAVPNREQLESDLKAANADLPAKGVSDWRAIQAGAVARRAKMLRANLDHDGHLPSSYPYPVQVWRLGDGPLWVFLGGEPVVDYALRLKSDLNQPAWIAGYSNDVMAYIPSRRVLMEGGYEGGGSMIYYGLPSPWTPAVEELVVKEVGRQAMATSEPPRNR